MNNKHLLKLMDLSTEEINEILNLADQLKYEKKNGIEHHLLKGKTLGMIFAKSSTRTRVSFEVGMYDLGGQALFLSSHDIQLGRGEPVNDTARVLSGYLDGIMIRTYAQEEVEDGVANGQEGTAEDQENHAQDDAQDLTAQLLGPSGLGQDDANDGEHDHVGCQNDGDDLVLGEDQTQTQKDTDDGRDEVEDGALGLDVGDGVDQRGDITDDDDDAPNDQSQPDQSLGLDDGAQDHQGYTHEDTQDHGDHAGRDAIVLGHSCFPPKMYNL